MKILKREKNEFTGCNNEENKESIWMVSYQMGGKEPVSPTSTDFTGPHSCLLRIWLCSSTPRLTEDQAHPPTEGTDTEGTGKKRQTIAFSN